MSKKTITYPFIGDVDFVKSRRARRLTLSVKPGRNVRMTLPWFLAWREAEKFLLRQMEWLKEKVSKARLYEEANGVPACREERKLAEEALRKKALAYLPGRTAELSSKHGFGCGRVTIRASRSRWGSCSANNNINLSLYLMLLPSRLIDYVIIHELVHTVHKNHGPQFWQLLEKHTEGARALAAEIKKYRINYGQTK
jgi:predicted metal-dependent hydrolase